MKRLHVIQTVFQVCESWWHAVNRINAAGSFDHSKLQIQCKI